MKAFFKFFFVFTIFSLQSKAQDDDSNAGFYVDGVKVMEINCYTFGNLKVVFPFNPAYSNYDRFIIKIYYGESFQMGNRFGTFNVVSKASVLSKVKNNYFVYDIFKAGEWYAPANNDSRDPNAYNGLTNSLSRAGIKYYAGKAQKPETDLVFSLIGETITGYRDEFDASGNHSRIPIYSAEILGSALKLHCVNREACSSWADDYHLNKKIDLSVECTFTGTKVDFNNLGKSTSSANNSINNNSAPTNNTPAKSETLVKTSPITGKTIITTVATTSAVAVKPLDKTKPGYFEEKSEDKKFMYRNGYQKSEGVYHGEVREYENNQLEKIIVYTDGVEDGLYVTFSEGKVEWQGTFKNGKKDGIWKHFSNGQLQETEKYVNGEKQD